MKKLEIVINHHNYTLACDDGQESHVAQLAEEIDMRAREIAIRMPKAGELMNLVMTCLTLADELYESRQEAGALHEHIASLVAAGYNVGEQEMSTDSTAPAKSSTKTAEEAQMVLTLTMREIADHVEKMALSVEERLN